MAMLSFFSTNYYEYLDWLYFSTHWEMRLGIYNIYIYMNHPEENMGLSKILPFYSVFFVFSKIPTCHLLQDDYI